MTRRHCFMRVGTLGIALLFALSDCTNNAQSNPPRTATEELLISTAAERAAAKLMLQIPAHATVFFDNANFGDYILDTTRR